MDGSLALNTGKANELQWEERERKGGSEKCKTNRQRVYSKVSPHMLSLDEMRQISKYLLIQVRLKHSNIVSMNNNQCVGLVGTKTI